jgi:hypothetical protein
MLLPIFSLGIGLFFGWLATYLYGLPANTYADPSLHRGGWEGPRIEGQGAQRRAVWTSLSLRNAANLDHEHEPAVCSVGPGVSHVDECVCGATRYGVYGAWS